MPKTAPPQPISCASCFVKDQILKEIPLFWYVIDEKERLLDASATLLHALNASSVSAIQDAFYTQWMEHAYWLEPRVAGLRAADKEAFTAPQSNQLTLEPPVTDSRGLVFYYDAKRVLLYDALGKRVGLLVILTDVTARECKAPTDKPQLKNRKPPYPPGISRDTASPPRFLVIEDNPIAQKATEHILQELDCQVDSASNAEELGHIFQPGKYDVILMDIGLAGTSGYLLSKEIRRIEGDSGYCVPIIALTGFNTDLVKADCDYYCMEGAMHKPLTVDQARQIVQRYVYQTPVVITGFKSL